MLWGTAMMRTQGDDVAEALALLGVRPVWEAESRRVVGLEVIPLPELGRPRIDITLRVSGFFRDAFPNLVHLVDEAVELVASLDEPEEDNFIRAHGAVDPRVYGPGPGTYGAGILQLLEQRNWRSDDDLAAVYIAWSGFAYSRQGFGVPAEDAMRRRFAAIDVAVKNQDNREHDIFDSDDYLQEHGGMIATIRSLTGRDPKAWFGDSANPARPQVRSLAEEAARVVRTRVVNPKWLEAMQRHGYKGAFEMAATVDYLFGYDATAHVVDDWMYERVTAAYVADPAGAEVLRAVESLRADIHCGAAARGGGAGDVAGERRSPAVPARRHFRSRGLVGVPLIPAHEIRGVCSPTVRADTEHGEVMGIDGEIELGSGGLCQTTEETLRGLDHLAARFTHEVSMGRSRQVVGGGSVAQVRVDDDAQALQLIEVPVDGRDVNVRCLRLDRCRQLFGGVVAGFFEEHTEKKATR